MRFPHFCFDFLGDENDKLLSEIRSYHAQLICGYANSPTGEWDYHQFPPVNTPKGIKASFNSTLTLPARLFENF